MKANHQLTNIVSFLLSLPMLLTLDVIHKLITSKTNRISIACKDLDSELAKNVKALTACHRFILALITCQNF